MNFPDSHPVILDDSSAGFYLRPRYRSERPLDSTLRKVAPGSDAFITETYAAQLAAIFTEWSSSLMRSPRETQAIANLLASTFIGASPLAADSRVVRSSLGLRVQQNQFASQLSLNRQSFLKHWQSAFDLFLQILTAEFQITQMEARSPSSGASLQLEIKVRYELVGTGRGFHREQRVGNWQMTWESSGPDKFHIIRWRVVDETQARSNSPF
jgi:hypothetical protein